MRMRTTTMLSILLVGLFGLAACNGGNGDGDGDTGNDTGVIKDTYEPEDTGMDTGQPDPDTREPEDSGMDAGDDTGTDTGGDSGADTTTDGGDTDADAGMDETSIREIRQAAESNDIQPGDSLSGTYYTSGVVVTGVAGDKSNPDGVFVQEPSGAPEKSGIWVYFGNAQDGVSVPSLEVGHQISVEGTVTNYDNNGNSSNGGLLEIHEVSSVSVDQQGVSVPSPVVIDDPSTLAPGGSNVESYESVLIEVQNVTVAAEPNQFDETELDSGLRIGAALYDYTADVSPTAGDTFSSIVGPLNFGFDKTKIVPRDQNDLTE